MPHITDVNYSKPLVGEIFLNMLSKSLLVTQGIKSHAFFSGSHQILNAKYLRIRERHLFLEYLGRAHYDPTRPSYISLERLVALPDETFCSEVALASLDDFERFQKTL